MNKNVVYPKSTDELKGKRELPKKSEITAEKVFQ